MIRATKFGTNIKNYFENIEKDLLIVCQIETEEGVSNIEDIANVEGVDMLFIGPMDLSANVGCFGNFDNPKFVNLIEKAKKKVVKSNKFSGIIPYGNYSWQNLLDYGFDLTTAGTELTLLRDTSKEIIKKFNNLNK